jgi:hypothetical protein
MPRVNRTLVYLGACIIAGLRLAREKQVNVRVIRKRTPIPSGERDIEGLRIGSWLIQRK